MIVAKHGETIDKEADLAIRADWLQENGGCPIIADLMRIPHQSAYEWGIPQTKYIRISENVGIEFVLIPHGVGYLGEKCDQKFDFPKPIYMSKYPITEEQYLAVMGKKPSAVNIKNAPVDSVNWHEARDFARKLGCRLPFEAEWEYACRSGTKTRYSLGESWQKEWGNCKRNSKTPVGNFLPNYWDLYDMHGNVWEWCEDEWSETMKKPYLEGNNLYPLEFCEVGRGSTTPGSAVPPYGSTSRPRSATSTSDSASSSDGEHRDPFGASVAVPGAAFQISLARPTEATMCPRTDTTLSASVLSLEGEESNPFVIGESFVAGRGSPIPCSVARPTETAMLPRTATTALGSASSSEGEQSSPFASFVAAHGTTEPSTVVLPTAAARMSTTPSTTGVSVSSLEGEESGPFGIGESCVAGRGVSILSSVARTTATTMIPRTATTSLGSGSSLEGEESSPFVIGESFVAGRGSAILSSVARPNAASMHPRTEATALGSGLSLEVEYSSPFAFCEVGRGSTTPDTAVPPTGSTSRPGTATSTSASVLSSEGEQGDPFASDVVFVAGLGTSVQCTVARPNATTMNPRTAATSLGSGSSSSEVEDSDPFVPFGADRGTTIHCTVARTTDTNLQPRSDSASLVSVLSSEGEERPFSVLRGGSWCSDPLFCRSAYRNGNAPSYRYGLIGFRVIIELS